MASSPVFMVTVDDAFDAAGVHDAQDFDWVQGIQVVVVINAAEKLRAPQDVAHHQGGSTGDVDVSLAVTIAMETLSLIFPLDCVTAWSPSQEQSVAAKSFARDPVSECFRAAYAKG